MQAATCLHLPLGPCLQALIHRLSSLLEAGGWEPDSPAGQELCTIVTLRVSPP